MKEVIAIRQTKSQETVKAVSARIPNIITQPTVAGSDAKRQTAIPAIGLPPSGVPPNLRLPITFIRAILPGLAAHSAKDARRLRFVSMSVRDSTGRLLIVKIFKSTLQPTISSDEDAMGDRDA
jgi:hypothetical protein